MHRICVGALVMRTDGGTRVLLGHRAPARTYFPNVWDVPGGHCEQGESLDETLVRELEEELAITPTRWRLIREISAFVPGSSELVELHLFEVTAWRGEPVNRATEEHDVIAWFSIDEACELELGHPAYPELFRTLNVSET
jgi:8-oxo-dGTP diphosphatase